MNSFKEMTKKLTYIILISMLLLLASNVFLLLFNFNKYGEDLYNAYFKGIYDNLVITMDSLKNTSQVVAHNKEIIRILENNIDINDISPEEKSTMLYEISLSESFLHNLSFVSNISISSIDGDYLFNNSGLFRNFNIEDRPWFDEYTLDNRYKAFIVPVHKDFTTGEYVTSIVSFILNANSKILGVATLDIYVDDFLKYLESEFDYANIHAHLLINGDYYPPLEKNFDKAIYHKVNADNIVLYFDKTASMYFNSSVSYLKSSALVYVLIFLLILILNFFLAKKITKPIENSLTKFKSLLDTKDDLSSFSQKGELEQLELLSGMLSKSFDDKIDHLIYYDDFTDLPNKKSLIKITNDLIKNYVPFALIFIDIANMRTLVDLFGYDYRDKIIKEFSTILSLALNDDIILTIDLYNKFVLICPNYVSFSNLELIYKECVLDVFENTKLINNTTKLDLIASVSIYPEQGNTLDTLLRKNEFMINIGKRDSLYNTLLSFNTEMYIMISRIESIKQNLKTAIQNNELKIYYQPIVDKCSSLKKLEALIRWNSPLLGNVSPVEFIKYAEETRDIVPIGYWIFEDVCNNYNKLNSINKSIQISINVSPIQLLDDSFASNVENIISRYGIDFDNICIEITESVLIETNEVIGQNLKYLSHLGVAVALDDFGTGYSSFGYLKQFNFNMLKLDKVFLANATKSDYEIIKSIRDIAKELGIDTLAEGVESKEQFDNLVAIDIDYFQGYYFSKPLSLEDLIIFL